MAQPTWSRFEREPDRRGDGGSGTQTNAVATMKARLGAVASLAESSSSGQSSATRYAHTEPATMMRSATPHRLSDVVVAEADADHRQAEPERQRADRRARGEHGRPRRGGRARPLGDDGTPAAEDPAEQQRKCGEDAEHDDAVRRSLLRAGIPRTVDAGSTLIGVLAARATCSTA